MKKCGRCKKTLDNNKFYAAKNTGDGLFWQCKKCATAYTLAYRNGYRSPKGDGYGRHNKWRESETKMLLNLIEKRFSGKEIATKLNRPISTIYYQIHILGLKIKPKDDIYKWKSGIISSLRYRARKKNIPFNLTIDDIPTPTHCEVLDIELCYSRTKRSEWENRPEGAAELDKIIPKKGYVKGNICVISSLANRLKSNLTEDQLVKILDYIKSHR